MLPLARENITISIEGGWVIIMKKALKKGLKTEWVGIFKIMKGYKSLFATGKV